MLNPDPGHAADTAPSPLARVLWPLIVLALGYGLLLYLGARERALQAGQFWGGGLLVAEGTPFLDDSIPISVRRLPEENFPPLPLELASLLADPEFQQLLPSDKLNQRERVVCLPSGATDWQALLASGRAPMPGSREVLAGALTRFDHFVMDGERFEVVGRIARGVAGLGFAYVLPDTPEIRAYFTAETGATTGWFAPEGQDQLRTASLDKAHEKELERASGVTPNPRALSLGAIAALMLMLVGGSVAQVRLLQHAGRSSHSLFAPFLRELRERPRLLWSVHLLLFGTWLFSMLVALEHPHANMLMVSIVRGAFTDGGLKHVGDAYVSGNVLRAAWATFQHNYFIATVLVAILPSLVLPFAGLAINLVRFGIVGFSMAPIWTGHVTQYSYHSITMVLELEPYILASFFVCLLPIRVVKGLKSGQVVQEWGMALQAIAGGTVVIGFMLALAALYEATTLILLR